MADPRTHIYSNNASCQLGANLTAIATTLTLETGEGSLFPDPEYPEIFVLTVEDFSDQESEIMYCTARSGDELTVERGKEGTSARAFSTTNNVVVQHRCTAGTLEHLEETAAAAGEGGVTNIGDLADVDDLAPTHGYVLTWDENQEEWAPRPVKAVVQMACSDLTTDLAAGTSKAYVRMAHAMELTEVRASLLTAGTTATTVDINKNGSTILSTKITIDANEKTSESAATPAVISDFDLADDDEVTVDIDGAGTDAAGLIVTLIGTIVSS